MPKKLESFMNGERVAEMWEVVATALAGKVDLAGLDNYATLDAVAAAIAAALDDYMKKSEVNAAVAEAAGIRFRAVESLPEAGEDKVIYLVPNGRSGNNVRDEYMWLEGKWEILGSTEVDLTGYWSKEELRPLTAEELEEILV